YQKILGETIDSDFTKDIAPISEMEMRVIDEEIADKLGDKTLGEDPSLGSVAEVNNFTLQSVSKKLYYVAPLEHSGFFKWYNNDYTTGYIKVSATNQNDISLVQEIDGKPIKIKYQPSAYFGEDLYRHIWNNGYKTSLVTDIQFEIDDEGYPWWIVTKFEKKVTMGGSEAVGCLVINPETGEIKEYSISETPKWIDRVQPINFIKTQIDDWGEYIHGWWNFSGRDKLTSSSGATVVYGNDNQCYVYTGITSVGSDEGTVGFMMVNTVTKKVFRYNRTGATEEAAKRSAESQVQEKGYKATFPIPYNVNGTPTYFMSLVGDDGLPKMYAMVSIQNYNIVGVGGNLKSTLRSYQRALTSKGNATGIETSFERKQLTGSISRISNDISDGQTSYYFILDSSNIIFRGSSDISVEIPLSKEGDVLKITYDDSGQPVTQIVSFDNLEIEMIKSSINEERLEYFQEVDSTNFQKNELKNANQVFDDMSDEKKLELLKQVKNQ
ncbi:MAG: hypothetical protein MRY57_02045, partial [Candidatus Pacebacteria bacterium]|nr:hypothetical protein [Candidatus Paceibacterota bacterium]